jgi:hypothetical protein
MLAAQTDPVEPNAEARGLAGVSIEVVEGRVASCAPEIDSEPSTWGVGTPDTWFDVVIDGQIEDLRIGGTHPQLALDLVAGLHFALFIDR